MATHAIMQPMENETKYRLTPKQVVARIISVIVCGIGASSCFFSVTLQMEEVGTTIARVVWFAGLGCAVAACAGYAASCDPGKGKSWKVVAVICAFLVAAGVYHHFLEDLYAIQVAYIALVALAVEALWLVIYHFILKFQDPLSA